mmetsp:Transcript_113344/g.178293  ORF Transcript_113344/g.178293 Transcript_113344/m.178293 type:complete len:298 (+) Transcript_113344:72-965(+)
MFGKQNEMPWKIEIASRLESPLQLLQAPIAASLLETNVALAQHNQFLMSQKEQLERKLRCMELLAVIGLPPGLSNATPQELSHLPLKNARKDSGDQSTTCSFSPRNSSPSGTGRNSDASEHCFWNSSPGGSGRNSDASELCFFAKTCQERRTTLIIRNLVGHCNRRMLCDFMDRHGFQGKYDLLYLPQRFAGKGCFHYAFVNFVTESTAAEFQERLSGCDEADLFGEQAAEISWSQCQGLEANIEKFRNSSTMHPSVHDECRPLLFKNGKVAPFPKPTRRIKKDKRHRKEAEEHQEA